MPSNGYIAVVRVFRRSVVIILFIARNYFAIQRQSKVVIDATLLLNFAYNIPAFLALLRTI